ncbi:hypothetical protein Acr_13g0005430 [Actinidia rufa]|uniref:Uncharacterized protein n=1 Tax=Actinidia rufa TaxID=165716 RepID=A0A7J0FKB7_9ERIC|nr:hypothetical protein Acr_13g0005430 [Actinidia rufa]
MVLTKQASNDLRGDGTYPAESPMVFKPRIFKSMEFQRTWLPEFRDRPIITGREFERSFPTKYYLKMLASMDTFGYIAYNIIPKTGHYNQVTTIDAFIICKAMIGEPLNLNYVILKEMADRNQYKDKGFSITTIKRGISIDSTENREHPVHGEVPMHDEFPMHGEQPSQEGTSAQRGPQVRFLEYFRKLNESIVRIELRQEEIIQTQARQEPFIDRLEDLVEKHGQNIDRLGDSYENLYEQHTTFNQQYSY